MNIEQDHAKGHDPLILLIDDDPAILRVFKSVLSIGGYTVESAKNGKEAVHLIETQSFDAIISDVDLPDHDGFEICKLVRKSPSRNLIPIILMSGRLPEEQGPKAMEAGASDFLGKPFPAKRLLETLSRALSTSSHVA